MRTIIFGDAHGCIDQIRALMDKIGPARDDRIISLGDFVDRGPDSPACTAFVQAHESIMGNHEYKHVRGILSPSQKGAREQFVKQGKDYDTAVEYMRTLPFFIELPEIILIHAGLEYGIPMEQQNRIVLVGGMSERRITGIDKKTGIPYWCARYPRDVKPVAFGHLSLPGDIPLHGNLFPLDTGCCAGRFLTALILPEFHIVQVPGWKHS